jgi:hypothetical protein
MPCEIRSNMIICSRGRRKAPRCKWCSNTSTKLCDYKLPSGKTCDAPMCDIHAKRIGPEVDHCMWHR